MPYIDYTYYEKISEEPVDEAGFLGILLRAEEIVEELTMYRLCPETFSAMNDWMKERVKKAVCAQVDYIDANGGVEFDDGTDFQSAALGKFNYTKGSGGSDSSGSSGISIYSGRTIRLLAPTGLLYRGAT